MPEKELQKKKLQAKRKTSVPTNISMYMFNNFDDYLDFCHLITDNQEYTYSFLKKSALYSYKSKYYLCLYINNKEMNSFKSVHYEIIEFASHVNNSDLFERKLKEYGKIIFKTNAIKACEKYFK